MVVLAEEVIGGLAKVLYAYIKYRFGIRRKENKKVCAFPATQKKGQTNLPGRGDGLRERHRAVMKE